MNELKLSNLVNSDNEGGYHIPRTEINKLIMNYLVTEGYKEVAEKFKSETGIQPGLDLDSIDDRIRIRESILSGKIEEAISLIDNLFPELLENNKLLFFHLQQQHLIELIRENKIEMALDFAHKHLASQGEADPDLLTELERTMALLAFDEPQLSCFGDLLNSSQRQKVASDVNTAILESDSSPKLETFIKLLHWSQFMLDAKKVTYSKMTDVSRGVTT